MPHTWNNILCVTKEELVPEFFPTYEALKKKLQRYAKKPYGIKRAQRGGNCRQLRVVFASLDEEIRNAIGDPTKENHILDDYYIIDAGAQNYFTNYQLNDGRYLPSEKIQLYVVNASLLTAVLEIKEAREFERKTKNATLRGISRTLLDDVISFTPILAENHKSRHSLPTSLRNFTKTLRSFEAEGYESIIEGYFNNKNSLKKTKRVTDLLDSMFATDKTKPTAHEVSRRYDAFLSGYMEIINADTGEVFDPKGFPKLSTSTIANYLSSWTSKIATYGKRSGDRQVYRQNFIPYHSLENPTFSGSLLSIDDRQPPFEYAKGKRLWWYVGIDLASEAITVWVTGETKEELIKNFYQQLVRQYHAYGVPVPAGLECESSLNSQYRNTILAPGAMFEDVRIEANNARGKRIERYFQNLRYDVEKHREGWIARPFAKAESNQLSSEKRVYIPKDRLITEGLQDIMTWNNQEHSKHPGISRWDYFMQNQNPDLKPTNYKAILPHIGHKTQSSCQAGIVHLQRAEWLLGDHGEIYTGDKLVNLMRLVEGKDLDIYWLDDNNGNVIKALVYIKGSTTCVCEVLPKPSYNRARIEQTPEQEEAKRTLSAYAMTIEGYRKERAATFEQLHIIDNRPKTIGSSFSIPGLEKFTPRENDVEELEDIEEVHEYKPEERTVKSWRDNF